MHVANKNSAPISESLLTTKYGVWPDLEITADNIVESFICKFIEIDDTGKEREVEIPDRYDPNEYLNQVPNIISKIPSKPNYTFKGWAIDKNGESIAINYDMFTKELTPTEIFNNNVFTINNNIITYYAVYEI